MSILCFVLLYTSTAIGSVPIISDIKVIGSIRGVAVAITADATFDATFQTGGTNSVKMTIKNAVYGLNTFNFSKFDNSIPIARMSVKELKNSSSVQITLTLKNNVDTEIQSKQKESQWTALLSRESSPDFKWSAMEADRELASSQSVMQAPVESEPAIYPVESQNTFATATESSSTFAELLNVRFFQRNKLAAINLDCNIPVQCEMTKSKDTITIQLFQTKYAGQEKKIVPPKIIQLKRVAFKEKTSQQKQSLRVSIVLDKSFSSKMNTIAQVNGSTVTVFLVSREIDKVVSWSLVEGVRSEYSFYDLPTNDIDMKSIESKAIRDVETNVENENAFYVREDDGKRAGARSDAQAEQDNSKTAAQMQVESNLPSTQSQSAGVSENSIPGVLIITSENATLHVLANMESRQIKSLAIGDKLLLIASKGQWINVKAGAADGWLMKKFATDSSKITSEKWIELNALRESIIRNDGLEEKNPIADSLLKTENVFAEAEKKRPNKVIKYRLAGRDPFQPISTDSVNESGLARIGNVRLVGVLLDNNERIALLEDVKQSRKPFALRENDPVEHGKVLKVYKDKVVFLITEFGISRSYTVNLMTKKDQEAGK
jgi:hypothetical protein